MKTRVYQYGLLPPTSNADIIRQQLRLGHDYRNGLTELERKRRSDLRALMLNHGAAQLAELTDAALAAKKELGKHLALIKAVRAKTRKRAETKEARDAVTAARVTLREARAALSQERKRMNADHDFVLARDALNTEYRQHTRELRAAYSQRGSHWGTRQLADMSHDASRQTPLWDGVEPQDPHFSKWRGRGRVGVQIQGGLAAASLFSGTDSRLRVDAVDERAWYSPKRSERRKFCRTTLRMRVTSDGRDPVWGAWPMLMHRPLPDGALIMRAAVSLRKRGPRKRWTVEITVRLPEHYVSEPCGKGAVAIDLGWRVMGDKLRVAAWYGEDGSSGELRIDARLISSLRYHEGLRCIRDGSLEDMRPVLAAWLKGRELPEWLSEATKTVAQWRAAARFTALVRRWSEDRFEGDEEGYKLLEGWRYQDHHLWQWECDQQCKSRRHRRELYRRFGATLARRYGTVVLEDLDLSQLARRGRAEDPADNETARSNRQLVSTHELRGAVCNAFASRGGAEQREPAEYTTMDCHACGSLEVWDQATEVNHRCSKCGTLWDQDDNAAHNLLARYCERLGGKKTPQAARKPFKTKKKKDLDETKWQRVARLGREKQQRHETAREAASTPQ